MGIRGKLLLLAAGIAVPLVMVGALDLRTGLGLYLAQHIVGQLNGEISVESAVGSGTTFTLRLPRSIDGVAADEREEDMHVKALAGG